MSGALILLPLAPIPSKPFTISSASSSSSSASFSLFRNSSISFQPLKSSIKRPSTFRDFRVRADDGDADGGSPDDYDMEDEEMEEVDNKKDYDVEYENLLTVSPFSTSSSGGDEIEMSEQSKSFVSTQGWDSEMVVDYRINEEEFHKICLLECDFFIRKPPDPDNDVYDFREMYVTPPDTDVYSIPRVLAPMPQKYIRCAKSDYGCYNVTEPPIDAPRDPMYKSEREIAKVFLSKHYRNRRSGDPDFVVDFEEIYVIDSKTKSITRAKVLAVRMGSRETFWFLCPIVSWIKNSSLNDRHKWIPRDGYVMIRSYSWMVTVPGGRDRDRKNDMLIIRDNGNSFKIIDRSERADPTTVIEREEWIKTRQDMERHLRKLRDFSVSNWF